MLKANQYPDAWEFTTETPVPPEGYPGTDRVKEFLRIFLNPRFFGKIIVWKNRFLNNQGHYTIATKGKTYISIVDREECIKLRRCLEASADYKGDLSIMFVPCHPDEFLHEIMKAGHYGRAKPVRIGQGSQADPLRERGPEVERFLSSDAFCDADRILAFTHDAEYLYEVFRKTQDGLSHSNR